MRGFSVIYSFMDTLATKKFKIIPDYPFTFVLNNEADVDGEALRVLKSKGEDLFCLSEHFTSEAALQRLYNEKYYKYT